MGGVKKAPLPTVVLEVEEVLRPQDVGASRIWKRRERSLLEPQKEPALPHLVFGSETRVGPLTPGL